MANTKQAIKMVRKIKKRAQFNRWWKSKVRSAAKDLTEVLSDKNAKNAALESYKKLQKAIDKASKKGVIHKNKAARLKSNYSKKLSATDVK